jgi:peptide chain release factor subunit 1
MMNEIRIVDGDVDLRGLVRELARVDHDGAGSGAEVLSMYVDVDPRTFASPATRFSSIQSAIDQAERAAPNGHWSGAIDRLRVAFATGEHGVDGARGLLLYTTPEGEATLVRLPWPVEQEVAFDRAVHVRQLVRSLPTSSWCVLLCNRRTARIMLGDRDHLEQVDELRDDVDGQHDQGGWSQTRFARNIQEQVDDHLRRVAAVVGDIRRTGAVDCLLVAAPAELRAQLESRLGDQVRRTMCGWVDVDVEHASVADVCAATALAMKTWDDDQLDRTLARLQQNAGRRERAVIGLEDALQALAERRVETLVVNDGLSHPGLVCPHGDWLATDGGVCPTHGSRLQPCADVVELAIEHAVRQDARITIVDRVDPHEEAASDGAPPERMAFQAMRALGGISAIVRFDLDEGARPTGQRSGTATSIPG